MNEALNLIYQSVKDRLKIPYEAFADLVKDWEIIPLEQDGKLIGGVMVKGNELHVGYATKPAASIRRNIKDVISPMLTKYGFIVTSVHKSNENGLKFCKRLGFVETAEISGNILLRCEGSKYVS